MDELDSTPTDRDELIARAAARGHRQEALDYFAGRPDSGSGQVRLGPEFDWARRLTAEHKRYRNTCPDDQMHESVTHRRTVCEKPWHENTADGGRAMCSGDVVYVHERLDGPAVARDSTHAPAPLRLLVR